MIFFSLKVSSLFALSIKRYSVSFFMRFFFLVCDHSDCDGKKPCRWNWKQFFDCFVVLFRRFCSQFNFIMYSRWCDRHCLMAEKKRKAENLFSYPNCFAVNSTWDYMYNTIKTMWQHVDQTKNISTKCNCCNHWTLCTQTLVSIQFGVIWQSSLEMSLLLLCVFFFLHFFSWLACE